MCSQSNNTGRSPLMLAVEKNNVPMMLKLLEIAQAQFTPMFQNKAADNTKAPLINNFELVEMLRNGSNLRVGKKSGKKSRFLFNQNFLFFFLDLV